MSGVEHGLYQRIVSHSALYSDVLGSPMILDTYAPIEFHKKKREQWTTEPVDVDLRSVQALPGGSVGIVLYTYASGRLVLVRTSAGGSQRLETLS